MQIHNANLFLTPIGRVNLARSRNEFESSDAGQSWNRLHQFVGPHVNYVQDPRAQMSRQQKLIVFVYRQIVEALSLRARKVNRRNLPKRLPLRKSTKKN